MGEADLDRVEHLVESIVNSDDLDVFEIANCTADAFVVLESVQERTVAIWSQLDIMVGSHQDLA